MNLSIINFKRENMENKENNIVTLDLTKEYDFIPVAQRGKEKPRIYKVKGISNRHLAQYETNFSEIFMKNNSIKMNQAQVFFDIAIAYISDIQNLILNGKDIKVKDLETEDKINLFDSLPFDEIQEVGEYIHTISKFPEMTKLELGKL